MQTVLVLFRCGGPNAWYDMETYLAKLGMAALTGILGGACWSGDLNPRGRHLQPFSRFSSRCRLVTDTLFSHFQSRAPLLEN
jgi:hypothetical protein